MSELGGSGSGGRDAVGVWAKCKSNGCRAMMKFYAWAPPAPPELPAGPQLTAPGFTLGQPETNTGEIEQTDAPGRIGVD